MKNKRYLTLVYLTLSAIAVFVILIFGVSQIIAFFKTGADSSNLMLVSSNKLADRYQPKITWDYDPEFEGRLMEEGTMKKIIRDYIASEYYQYQSLSTGNTGGLNDYFTEKSREHLNALAAQYKKLDQRLSSTGIEHIISLKFYSEDGTIASFEDLNLSFHKMVQDKNTEGKYYDTSAYDVLVLLEDNYWRVRHKIRKGQFSGLNKYEKKVNNIEGFTIQKKHIYLNNRPFHIQGINYYPKDHPWTEMWKKFEISQIQEDLKTINNLGFNTIRIFIPYETFGGAYVKLEYLEKLKKFLDVAEENDLKVIVTLFDFFLGYSLDHWTLADRHLEQIITPIKEHPAILGWDLKNEPDLDFKIYGKQDVVDWLNFMAKRIDAYDPKNLITIGWSQPEYTSILAEELDFLSFHYYRNPADLSPLLNVLDQIEKPLFLGETGMHSFHAWWFPFGKSEKEQADYIEKVAEIIVSRQLHYALWTLHDFSHIPPNVAGKWPWQKKPQGSYGIYTDKMETKPCYEVIKKMNIDMKITK